MLRKKKGLTLIEVIVAMAIFAIIVASLLPAFIFVARINVVSKDGVDITAIAQQEAEKFYGYSRNYKYNDMLDLAEFTGAYTHVEKNASTNEDVYSRTISGASIKVSFWESEWDETGNGSLEKHNGMTKLRIIVSLSNNPQNSPDEQIDSILLFKK